MSQLFDILLPALGKARDTANAIKCSSNLRAIGQGVAIYITDYKGTLPASNWYYGLNFVGGQQYPTTPASGYVHWSALIFAGGKHVDNTDPAFQSNYGWDIFKCPALDKGGLAPANTYAGNSDGLANEAGAGVVDVQAPRLAYMLNEQLTPRSRLSTNMPGPTNTPYHFVQASRVRFSSETILATEMWGSQLMVTTTSQLGGGTVSNSRQPVSAIDAQASGVATADKAYTITDPWAFKFATPGNLKTETVPDPVFISSFLLWLSRCTWGIKTGSGTVFISGRFLRMSWCVRGFLELFGRGIGCVDCVVRTDQS